MLSVYFIYLFIYLFLLLLTYFCLAQTDESTIRAMYQLSCTFCTGNAGVHELHATVHHIFTAL